MKTGAEPKKVAILAGLVVVIGVVVYENYFAGDSEPAAPSRPAAVIPEPAAAPAIVTKKSRRDVPVTTGEFKLRQGPERPEDRVDPATIDPTLRLDLLAKVQSVEPEQSFRNIFQYGSAPPPPQAAKPIVLPKGVPQIPINNKPPVPVAPVRPGPPPAPSAPPLTFKYYGYRISRTSGRKEAFLLDGDDIIVAPENASIKNARYKVVSIGLTSITIEDTQFKQNQTLRIQEEPAG